MSGEQAFLEVTTVRDAGRVRVHLRGELDLATAPQLTERVARLRERGEPVVIDFDDLAFIDMSGLRAVLAAAEDASRHGVRLTVTRGSAPVQRLMALVSLDGHLPVEASST